MAAWFAGIAGDAEYVKRGSVPMKIRIQDSSVRFRISLKELETLNSSGRIEALCEIYSSDGAACEGRFIYAVEGVKEGTESYCVIGASAITLYLIPGDLATLNSPEEEGVYLRRESRLPTGIVLRSMVIIEKDRPAKACAKPEAWIYEHGPGGEPPSTRPIPPKA